MKTRPNREERGLPDLELWEAPQRLTDLDLAIHWGVERRWTPTYDTEDDR